MTSCDFPGQLDRARRAGTTQVFLGPAGAGQSVAQQMAALVEALGGFAETVGRAGTGFLGAPAFLGQLGGAGLPVVAPAHASTPAAMRNARDTAAGSSHLMPSSPAAARAARKRRNSAALAWTKRSNAAASAT